jgi:hypothetical protein
MESRPSERIVLLLEFYKPIAGKSDVVFTFQPESGKTLVTWDMAGKNNFAGKAINLVIDCDAMIGGQFEKGLASLKSVVETPAK